MPRFAPQHCNQCDNIIRGILFWCSDPDCKQSIGADGCYFICEDCFRTPGQKCGPHLRKFYKHCILQECVTPEISRKICQCTDVSRIDTNGNSRELFPVDASLSHYNSGISGSKCGLLSLGEHVAEAKHRGLLTKLKKREAVYEKKISKEESRKKSDKNDKKDVEADYLLNQKRDKLEITDIADEDIPFYYKAYLDKYPFGNVHMALRFGPIVIENGVPG